MAFRDLFRPRPDARAVTAAATVLERGDQAEQARIRKGPRQWQKDAWDVVDTVPEIAYAAHYQSGALGRIRLIPAMQPDPREDPVPLDPEGDDDLKITDDERAACFATLNRLGSGPLPISEIQRLVALNLFVAGDGTLIGFDDAGVETWDVLSVDELVPDDSGDGWARKASPEGGTGAKVPLPAGTFAARLYQRHPRYSAWAWSSMIPVLPLAEELRDLTDAIHAQTRSRIPAGFLLLSHGFKARKGPVDPTAQGQPGEQDLDPNVRAMIEHMEAPIKDRRSASSQVPFVWFADRDDIQNGHAWISPDRAVDDVQAQQREEIIRRIATGVDLPAEVLSGKADLNHWTAWQVGEETWKYHLEPDAQILVWALTAGFYRPHLAAMGVEGPQRFLVWYDESPLTIAPNRGEDYRNAYDRMEVSGEAYRKAVNIPEDDAPDDEEVALRIYRGMLDRVTVRTEGLPTPDEIVSGEIRTVAPDAPDDEPHDEPPAVEAGPPPAEQPTPRAPTQEAASVPPLAVLASASPMAGLGARLRNIEATLRARLLQAADDATRRALERSGNRLRNLANRRLSPDDKEHLRALDAIEVAGWLGPERVAALGTSDEDLLDGAFVALGVSFDRWVGHRQAQALQAISDAGDLDEADRLEIQARLDEAREEGKALLVAGLLAAAAALLYDPTVTAPEVGEFSDYTVKPGLIRQALITAGGGADETTSGMLSGIWFHDAVSRAHLTVRGFVWVHGDPIRPYEPHEALDGERVTGPGDDLLSVVNGEDWLVSPVDGHYWPGDHDGCTCDTLEEIEPEGTDA